MLKFTPPSWDFASLNLNTFPASPCQAILQHIIIMIILSYLDYNFTYSVLKYVSEDSALSFLKHNYESFETGFSFLWVDSNEIFSRWAYWSFILFLDVLDTLFDIFCLFLYQLSQFSFDNFSAGEKVAWLLWNAKVQYCVHKNPQFDPVFSEFKPLHSVEPITVSWFFTIYHLPTEIKVFFPWIRYFPISKAKDRRRCLLFADVNKEEGPITLRPRHDS